MYFNSLDTFYKTPYGAVPQGCNILFRIKLPCGLNVTSPALCIKYDGEPEKVVSMQLNLALCNGTEDVFEIFFHAEKVGLYFYYFDLYKDFIKIFRADCGNGFLSDIAADCFQLTVYDKSFSVPEKFFGGVMYQIFPDRFYESVPHAEMPFEDRVYRADKDGEPYFQPNETGGYLNRDYFGGDLKGIAEKLEYLASLNVTCIYLNPIFEAHSNHRYNTANYLKIDPLLGTARDFEDLCSKAKKLGISIILDGVFSHTGADSIYFNKYGRYGDIGAYSHPDSPYRPWYDFSPDYACGYRSWWGFESLPEVNETSPSFTDYICGEGGVIDTWLSAGADGFRLDVADELPDEFIEKIRAAVKRNGPDKLLIGEVWEDATNKFSYGQRRTYLLGQGLDSVMNYPFRNAVIRFITEGAAEAAADEILSICQNYPLPALNCAMNFLSTHDTERITTVIADEPCNGRDRCWQSGRRVTGEQLENAKVLLRLAYAFLFFLPGIPCIYYGDEIAMQGYRDPFNRGYYNWNETDNRLRDTIRGLAEIRRKNHVFRSGKLWVTRAENNVIKLFRGDDYGAAEMLINRSENVVFDKLLGNSVEVAPYDFKINIK